MLDCRQFYEVCRASGIDFFTGVPDSLLKHFCACLHDIEDGLHQIAANEGGAIGLATGHYIATGKPALVYLQNSGQGNAVNPLLSICDPEVYGIPMVLLVGWRGEPGVPDEPQHAKQGSVTRDLFSAMDIPHSILSSDRALAEKQLRDSVCEAVSYRRPVVLMVRKGTFSQYECSEPSRHDGLMLRSDAIEELADALPQSAAVVSTTGHISRELFALRKRRADMSGRDFLMVGGMGHASQVALALAKRQSHRQIFCFDGDGAALMHMGSMAIAGQSECLNFKHVVLNNGAHGSVGGQPTVGLTMDFSRIAEGCGYHCIEKVSSGEQLHDAVRDLVECDGPAFLEIRVSIQARLDLERPDRSPVDNLKTLMEFLRDSGH